MSASEYKSKKNYLSHRTNCMQLLTALSSAETQPVPSRTFHPYQTGLGSLSAVDCCSCKVIHSTVELPCCEK